MLKVIVIGDGINFELDGVPEHVAPNIMSWAIAGRYGDVQPARITPPAAISVPEQETTDQDQEQEPP